MTATRYSMSTMRNRLGSTLNLLLFVLVSLAAAFRVDHLKKLASQRENPIFLPFHPPLLTGCLYASSGRGRSQKICIRCRRPLASPIWRRPC